MSQLVLARGNAYKKNLFQKYFPRIEFGPYFLVFSLIFFVGLVTVITLMFSANQVTKGYVLNSLEARHQELSKQNEIMDMKISQVKSLNAIQASHKVSRMVQARQVVFVSGDSSIAKR